MNTLASEVLRTGVRAVRQDYQAQIESNRWKARTLQHGIRSVATFPVRRGGTIYAAFSLYANEANFFDAQLLALADDIAGDLSFALDNIDRKSALVAAASARESQLAADAANQAKTAFLSKMSHELRTPLNAMLGFTQLIQRDAQHRLVPQDIAQLERIRHAGRHLLSLVNDILDISSIESGRFDVQLRSLALTPLLEETLRIAEQQAAQSGIAIGAAFRNVETAQVIADPVRLRQVLINLLSNACKYNRPGGKVHITVVPRADTVDIEVVDTGLGMTAEQLAHLYEPFNRLGRELGGIKGTGLGLALTRQLVDLMGGELAFHSSIGVGTRATVTLRKAGEAERRGPAAAAGWLPSVAPAEPRDRAAVSPAGGGGPGSIGPGAAAAALQLPFQQPEKKKKKERKKEKKSHEDVETPPAKSKEQIPVVMALLKLDPAGFQEIKSCQARTYRGGRKTRDEIPALEDLFPAPLFAEEPAEMSRRSASPERCGERTR